MAGSPQLCPAPLVCLWGPESGQLSCRQSCLQGGRSCLAAGCAPTEPHPGLSAPLVLQTDLQGVHRPAGPGPIAPGELAAQPHPGAGHPELFDPLQPHLPRLRQPGGVRRGYGPAELSHRGPQGHGQNVPQQQPQQPHGQQRQKQ